MMAGFVALTFVLFKQESQMKENIQLWRYFKVTDNSPVEETNGTELD